MEKTIELATVSSNELYYIITFGVVTVTDTRVIVQVFTSSDNVYTEKIFRIIFCCPREAHQNYSEDNELRSIISIKGGERKRIEERFKSLHKLYWCIGVLVITFVYEKCSWETLLKHNIKM